MDFYINEILFFVIYKLKFIKKFIWFLDTEFKADFEKNIFYEFWKDFDSEIKYFSNIDTKFMKNFIRFLDAEFHADFEKNIIFEF